MPILVRPVREQLEHDRIIRLLLARYKKKHDAVTNVGGEPPTAVVIGTTEFVPDVILLSTDKARKLEGVVEVETGESVNSLETLAQWGPFSRLRVPFHLYVPPHTLDTVRRLCREHNVTVAELWTYHTNLDQVRFTLIQKAPDAALAAARKAGLSGTPKLKVAPPPPPPPPPPPAPPAAPPVRPAETKVPLRTAAQKAALGKFVAAAAKASAAKSAAAGVSNIAKPAPVTALAPSTAAGKSVAAKSAKAPVAAKPPVTAPAAKVPAAKAAKPAVAALPVKPAAAAKPVATLKPALPVAKVSKPAPKAVPAPPARTGKSTARPLAAKPAAKAPLKTGALAKGKSAKPAKGPKRR